MSYFNSKNEYMHAWSLARLFLSIIKAFFTTPSFNMLSWSPCSNCRSTASYSLTRSWQQHLIPLQPQVHNLPSVWRAWQRTSFNINSNFYVLLFLFDTYRTTDCCRRRLIQSFPGFWSTLYMYTPTDLPFRFERGRVLASVICHILICIFVCACICVFIKPYFHAQLRTWCNLLRITSSCVYMQPITHLY